MLSLKNRILIFIKQIIIRVHYKLFNIEKADFDKIVYFPVVKNEVDLAFLFDKLNWYLPQKQNVFLHFTGVRVDIKVPSNVIFVDKSELKRILENKKSLILLNSSWLLFSPMLIFNWSNIKIIDHFFILIWSLLIGKLYVLSY